MLSQKQITINMYVVSIQYELISKRKQNKFCDEQFFTMMRKAASTVTLKWKTLQFFLFKLYKHNSA